MRSFQGSATLDPVPGDVVQLLRRIDRAAGSEARHAHQLPELLRTLQHQARIESVTASSAIEGVIVEPSRVTPVMADGDRRLRDRSEEEFAGYAAALDHLQRDDPGDLSVGLLLHLHRLLFSFTDGGGGRFKIEDNLVLEGGTGPRVVRFVPVSAAETPFYVHELTERARDALASEDDHPLLAAAAVVLDLLCIHPFADGNGRVARLVTTYLLQGAGYGVGRYVSIEQLVYDTKDEYYASLAASTEGWFDGGRHDLWPWARYLLGRIDRAYQRYEARVADATSGGTKQERVRRYVLDQAPHVFAISDVRDAVPGVSDNTIRLVLAALQEERLIVNDAVGRGATWRRLG